MRLRRRLRAVVAAPLPLAPVLASKGAAVALGAWWVVQVLMIALIGVSLAALVAVRRERATAPGLDVAVLALGIGGGGVLWFAEAWAVPAGQGGLVAFAVVTAISALLATLPDQDEDDGRARIVAAAGAVALGLIAALAPRVQELRMLLFDAGSAGLGGGVQDARSFGDAALAVFSPWIGAWSALALALAAVALRRSDPAHRRSLWGWRAGASGAALALLLVGPSAWTAAAVGELGARLVPGWLAAAIAHASETVGRIESHCGRDG